MFTKFKTPKSNIIAASAPHSAPKVSHPNPTPQHPSHFSLPRPESSLFRIFRTSNPRNHLRLHSCDSCHSWLKTPPAITPAIFRVIPSSTVAKKHPPNTPNSLAPHATGKRLYCPRRHHRPPPTDH